MIYSRQTVLKEIGKKGQNTLNKSTISIVGTGALGTNSAELLTRAGIKRLILVDNEKIELSNLQRQTLFTKKDIGKYKVDVAKKKLQEINPKIQITTVREYLSNKNINKIKADIILDCTDNLGTRFLVNDFSLKNKIPWIYSAAIKTKGFVFNIIPNKTCLRCFLNRKSDTEICEDVGVLNTIISSISSIQVTQAIKILLKKDYEKDLIIFDVWENNFEKIKVKKNKKCNACKGNYEFLKNKSDFVIDLCLPKNNISVIPKKEMNLNLKKLKTHFKVDKITSSYILSKNHGGIAIYSNGEIVFDRLKDEKKIKEIAENIYAFSENTLN